MQTTNHIEHYAVALFSIWKETENKTAFQTSAQEIYFSLKSDSQIIEIIDSNNLTKKERNQIIETIYQGKVLKIFLNFLHVLVDNNFFSKVLEIFKTMFQKIYDENNIIFLKVISPFQLTNSQIKKIKNAFSIKSQKNVIPQHYVDKTLIGGIKIVFGDKSYDYSIKGKIEDLKWKIEQQQGV